jgi:hypothetical protein
MEDFSCTIDGVKELGEVLNVDKIRTAVKRAVYFFAEECMAASKEVCPVDTGNLMDTGHVGRHTPPGVTPMEMAYDTEDGGVAVDLGYGDSAVGYALYVHEELNPSSGHAISLNWSWAKAAAAGKQIQWTKPGSGPKFLENPIKERQDQLPGRIMDMIKRAMEVS